MEKNPDPGSGMNIPNLIFENLVGYQIFGLKMLKLFDADPAAASCQRIRDGKSQIRDKHPGSATLRTEKKYSCSSEFTNSIL
jgi:hypothetical protein